MGAKLQRESVEVFSSFHVPMEMLNRVPLAKYTCITARSPLFIRADTKVSETLRERR